MDVAHVFVSLGVKDHAAVSDSGDALIEGAHQIPGGEYSAVSTDPHGVAFGLVGPRKE